ncbi:dihydrofolate synthase / folylpolyglutamate synthase [Abditibacterium utsteinense]|uniref:Dihydrofolate synthase/folylpolyglutamate synthase n=1 Tax=Abditibacterium utsteinense TaxID=1960156 RepID=A0A2S8SVW6_9BACT|nr:folylpolyglutamate synthase/dihydrofolate synthase family protein [Abditibacterium utsteinense]PQV64935.1 dihydrofolate synthase / folylpolyglutamate synthase [Abditibacterium utsteinense]
MTQLETYLQNLQRFGIQPGLERIRALLQSAGNPQLKYPTILVGGTNGKGSTCEFAVRLLAQNSRKVGLYTSPHLYTWNERIRILPGAGLFEGAISDADLDAIFEDAKPHIENVARELGQPTEFEVVTFLGFWHFARQKVDAAVIEVGLGGKWDATNVCEPLVSVVTHVALDHMDRLGNTLEAIAADKVCIARAGRPFLTGEDKPEVLEVFQAHCVEIGARFHQHLFIANAKKHPTLQNGQNFSLSGFAVDAFLKEQNIATTGQHSLGHPQIPGRFEQISENPKIIIDGANNPDGADYLTYKIQNYERIQPENLILVLGILVDKDWPQMTEILAPLAKVVVATQSASPRAAPASQIAEVARQFCANVEEVTPVVDAVARAKSLARPEDTILVTGSFTTIAEVPRESSQEKI